MSRAVLVQRMRNACVALLPAALSTVLTLVSFEYASDSEMYGLTYYLSNPAIVALNLAPVLLWMTLCWALTKRIWLALLATELPVLVLTYINYCRLKQSYDILMLADLWRAPETLGSACCAVAPEPHMLQILLGLAVLTLVLTRLPKCGVRRPLRLACTLTSLFALVAYFAFAASSVPLYESVVFSGDWLPTEQYVSHGTIYSFLHSARSAFPTPPEGYSAAHAKAALAAYADDDIPNDRKVDIIAVMFEAFDDFSGFECLNWLNDPYAPYHALKAESYSGELVTNVFAGETVNTERAFLTGWLDPTDPIRARTDSFVWYLRRQGYLCESVYASYRSFFNHGNVNALLGFEVSRFSEDIQSPNSVNGALPMDAVFLPMMLARYSAAQASGKPYFGFGITFQNHGPYSDTAAYDTPFLSRSGSLDDAGCAIINNYLTGVADTCCRMAALIDGLRAAERPVVAVLFGDHAPWMGEGEAVYEALNISLDCDTEEGFYNRFCTPYLIWANDAAKAALGFSFTGDGGRLSPAFLMGRLFQLAGWDGPAYMKALWALEAETPFVNRFRYALDDGLCFTDGPDAPEWLCAFRRLQFYQKRLEP